MLKRAKMASVSPFQDVMLVGETEAQEQVRIF